MLFVARRIIGIRQSHRKMRTSSRMAATAIAAWRAERAIGA